MTRTPVDLVVTNELHDVARKLERLPEAVRTGMLDGPAGAELNEQMARGVLCALSHHAQPHVVLAALAAAGAPATLDEIGQRFRAVCDSRKPPEPATAAPATSAATDPS